MRIHPHRLSSSFSPSPTSSSRARSANSLGRHPQFMRGNQSFRGCAKWQKGALVFFRKFVGCDVSFQKYIGGMISVFSLIVSLFGLLIYSPKELRKESLVHTSPTILEFESFLESWLSQPLLWIFPRPRLSRGWVFVRVCLRLRVRPSWVGRLQRQLAALMWARDPPASLKKGPVHSCEV